MHSTVPLVMGGAGRGSGAASGHARAVARAWCGARRAGLGGGAAPGVFSVPPFGGVKWNRGGVVGFLVGGRVRKGGGGGVAGGGGFAQFVFLWFGGGDFALVSGKHRDTVPPRHSVQGDRVQG